MSDPHCTDPRGVSGIPTRDARAVDFREVRALGSEQQALIECRRPALEKLKSEILSHDRIIVGTVARSGNSSSMRVLAEEITEQEGGQALFLTAEIPSLFFKKIQEAIDRPKNAETGEVSKLTLLIDESANLMSESMADFSKDLRSEE